MTTPIPIRSERRLGVVFVFFILAFAVLLLRLFQLQFLDAAEIGERVQNRRTKTEKLKAFRGNILDRNGRPLAQATNSYDLRFLPAKFREANRIDALQDLLLAWCPEVLPSDFAVIPKRFADRKKERWRRFRTAFELRKEGVDQLLHLRCSELTFDKQVLVERFAGIRHPRGELILPPSKLKRRLELALILIADNEVCHDRRTLRLRLTEYETLGDALATTSERIRAGREAEWERLRHLSDEITPNHSEAFFLKIFEAEQRDIRRVKRYVERSLDDQICAIELGTHDLRRDLDRQTLQNLAKDLRVVSTGFRTQSKRGTSRSDQTQAIANALMALDEGDKNEVTAKKAEAAQTIMGGRRDLFSLENYELESLAEVLEIWDDNPERIKREFAKKIKNAPGFAQRRGTYQSIEKEWARTLQYKGGVPYTLFRGCGFPVAARVWRSFGLRDLGFDVSAAQGRKYWGNAQGIASQLIGRCNSRGIPLGGLESSLTRSRKAGGVFDAPLVGKDGRQTSRHELDGSWRTLEGSIEPIHGDDVYLTLDRELQARAETLTAEMSRGVFGERGAAVCVIEVKTGEIMVLASSPRFPGSDYMERFLNEADLRRERAAAQNSWESGDTSTEEFRLTRDRVNSDLEHLAFFERSVEGGNVSQSPPGSVLKPFAAAGLLQMGLFTVDEIFDCPEKGLINIWGAVERSSNPFFWEGAKRFGRKNLISWYQRFGMFRPIPLLTSGHSCRRRLKQVENDAIKNIVIGQGSVSMSVLEVASMMTNFARRGRIIEPIIVKQIGDRVIHAQELPRVLVRDEFFDGIFGAMSLVAQHYVPGNKALEIGLAGKTGTAELEGKHKGKYNAWFAGFAPVHEPRFAFAVVVERTHLMGKATAPYAARLIELMTGAAK